MSQAITPSNNTLVANTFGAVNPQPFPEAEPRIKSENTNQLSGFIAQQDRVSISPNAQAKAQAEQQIQQVNQTSATNEASGQVNGQEDTQAQEQSSNEFIQISSSIGRASSSGNLKRDEAMAIYQKIASLI